MAMNKQRKSSNLLNILNYDDAGNIVLRDYSQTIRYNWNGTIHAFTGPLSISSVAAAVTDTDRFLVSDGGVLKYRTGAEVLSDIGAFVLPSLTSGSVLFSNGTTIAQNNANFFWDAANARLGIGTNAPAYRLHNVGTSAFDNGNSGDAVTILNQGFLRWTSVRFRGFSSSFDFQDNAYSTKVSLSMSGSSSIFNTGGNFLFGGTTDGGQRLQVYGDAFIKGSGATSATSALVIQDSAGTAMITLRNDGVLRLQKGYLNVSSNQNVLIGASDDGGTLNTSGLGITYGAGNRTSAGVNHGFYGANITNTSGAFHHIRTTGTPNFAPTSGTGTFFLASLDCIINQTGGANGITRGLYVNPTLTAAADWRSIEWSNNSGWGLYGAGTANNFLNGSLGIGSASLSNTNLAIGKNISGSTSAYGVLLDSVVQSGVTSAAYGFRSILTTQAASFTLSSLNHFTASQTTQGAGSIILNQVGFDCGDMNNAYTNISYRGQISQGTLQWNLYMSGTASNYLAGQLLIGTTTKGTFALDVNGTARVSGAVTAATESIFNGTSVNSRILVTANGVANTVLGFNNSGSTTTGVINNASYVGVLQNYPLIFITNSVERFRLSQTTGAATFTSSNSTPVTVIGSDATTTFAINNTNANLWGGNYAVQVNGSDKNYFGTLGSLLGSTNYDATIWATSGNGFRVYTNGNNRRFEISSTGAAEFTSSVTATSLVKSGGTSSQYLMADGSTSTLTNPVTGTGTTNFLPKWTSGSALGNSIVSESGSVITIAGNLNIGSLGSLSINAGTAATPLLTQTNNYTQLYRRSGGVGIYLGGTGDAVNFYDNVTHIFRSEGGGSERMRITSTGNLLVGTSVDQGYRVQITGSGDNMLNVWGATAPSIRLDNAASGATQRFVIGLATATNNFIQGANAGDVCMTPGTSSALVFGMWQTSSSSEVMRISTSSNVLIGKNTDSGQKLQVVGKVNLTSLPTSATGLMAGDIWNNGGVLNIV